MFIYKVSTNLKDGHEQFLHKNNHVHFFLNRIKPKSETEKVDIEILFKIRTKS